MYSSQNDDWIYITSSDGQKLAAVGLALLLLQVQGRLETSTTTQDPVTNKLTTAMQPQQSRQSVSRRTSIPTETSKNSK